MVASLLLLATGLVLLFSLLSPWWGYTFYSGSTSGSVYMLPGSSVVISLTNGSQSSTLTLSYHAAGFGFLGETFGVLELLLLASLIAPLTAGAIGISAERGLIRGWARGRFVAWAGLGTTLTVMGSVAYLTVGLPLQLHSGNPGTLCNAGPFGGSTPCSSFWGTDWGAGSGWYLALIGAVASLLATVAWWISWEDPWEEGTLEASLAKGRSTSPMVGPESVMTRPFDSPQVGAPPSLGAAHPSATPSEGHGWRAGAPGPRVASSSGTYAGGAVPRAGSSTEVGSPSSPAPTTPILPAIDPTSPSEVDQVARWKQQVDAGTMSPDQFAAAKTRLLSSSPVPLSPGARVPPVPRLLATLDVLRDLGAVSGPEFLQLRRRLLMQR